MRTHACGPMDRDTLSCVIFCTCVLLRVPDCCSISKGVHPDGTDRLHQSESESANLCHALRSVQTFSETEAEQERCRFHEHNWNSVGQQAAVTGDTHTKLFRFEIFRNFMNF